MKRRISLTLILMSLVCLLLSVSASAATVKSGTCGANGGNLTWTLDDQGTLTINGSGAMVNYSYDYYPWKTYRSDITRITIGNSVTTIGDYAFSGCYALKSVTIPDSVTTIGYGAFSSCSALTEISIPDSVTTIGVSAFYYCTSLKSVTIPDSVTTIDRYAFSSCSALTEISIPDSVTTIGESAFYCCTSLKSVTIGNSVTTIGDYAFSGCYALKSVTIPDSVTTIGYGAFSSCSALTEISIPDSVTTIGYYAFENCYALVSVTIPDSVTTIGTGAFKYCKALETVTIPDSVTTIDDDAFYDCGALVSVTIPDSVTTIGESAFAGCKALESVTIGSGVTTIGSHAFQSCEAIESITVSSRNPNYCSVDSVLFNKDMTTLIFYLGSKSKTSYIIPNSVTTISTGAFEYCEALETVTIPDSVTTISDYTFYGCGALTEIVIPDSVTTIGNYAFGFCEALESVTIGNSVTTISTGAFEYCEALETVTIPDSVTTIGEEAFKYCYALETVTIGNSVTTIGESAFYYCTSLKSVTIPDSVTTIGDYAFYACEALASVTIPDSVTTIDRYAFKYCYALETVTIGNGVTTIGSDAFCFCKALKSVTIGNSVTTIGDYAFYACEALASVTIPDSVTTIDRCAFYACDALKAIVFTGSAPEIGYSSFSYVTATAYYPSDDDSWTEDVRQDYGGNLTWVAKSVLKITEHPKSVTATVGDTATFVVTAQGDGIKYQWQYKTPTGTGWNNSSTGNPKTATLSVTATKSRDGYQYRCKITDADGKVIYSDAATLTVKSALSITKQPDSTTVIAGSTAKFTIVATGDGIKYQWQYKTPTGAGWNTASEGKTDTLSVEVLSYRSGYQYRCKITDANGKVIYSDAATLTVKPVFSITKQPESASVTIGTTATFQIAARGDRIKYQWQYKTPTSSGWHSSTTGNPKTATLSVEATERRDGYQYRCKVTDADGTVIYSDVVTLTVKPALVIIEQPDDVTAIKGDTAKFTVIATGEGLKYQWQYRTSSTGGWSNSSTGNPQTDTLSVEATERRDGYQYRCKVTDADGKVVYSKAATLTVKPALSITKQPVSATVTKGDTAKFTVKATGSDLKYQWQYKSTGSSGWSNSSSGKTNTLTVEALSYRNGYQYRCKITDAEGNTVVSDVVKLTVN